MTTNLTDTELVERLRAMYSHRGDGIPTQYVNPDGPEAADTIERLLAALTRSSDGVGEARLLQRARNELVADGEPYDHALVADIDAALASLAPPPATGLVEALEEAKEYARNQHDEGCELHPEFGEQNFERNNDLLEEEARDLDDVDYRDWPDDAECTCDTKEYLLRVNGLIAAHQQAQPATQGEVIEVLRTFVAAKEHRRGTDAHGRHYDTFAWNITALNKARETAIALLSANTEQEPHP